MVWALLLGGVLDRFARSGEERSIARFFRYGGRFFFRYVRLVLVSGVVYFLVYRLGRWIYGRVEDATRDVTVEKTVLIYSLAATALVVFLLVLVHVSFAYAKIATMVEDRRSMLLAAARGLRFVLSHPVRTLGLYFAIAVVSGAALALYAWAGPGAGQQTAFGVTLAFAFGQLFLMVRLALRMTLLAGQTALYQSLQG